MAGASNLLAQSNPSAATLTDLYTVPTPGARIGEIYMTNQDSVSVTVRLAVAAAGAANTAAQYLVYDQIVGVGRSLVLSFPPEGLQLGAATIIRGYASTASVSFNILGR